MKVLFFGGTGNISLACAAEALRRGMEVHVFQRGKSVHRIPEGAVSVRGDYSDQAATRAALQGQRFDVAVQFIGYRPEQVRFDAELLQGRVGQYVYISSTSVYRKPPSTPWITEGTPLDNPFWQYARDKIACEETLREAHRLRGFPVTIVRPSHTYADGWIPTSLGSRDWTVARRILDGKPVVVHGDGTSLWSLMHAEDFARAFVGLFGNHRAIGEAFHITSEELLSWNQIYETLAFALGRTAHLVHVSSEAIAASMPERGGSLLGDKAHTMIYDNAKIRRFVPGFQAAIPYHEGLRRSLAWFDADPARKVVNAEMDREMDALTERWAPR